LETCFEQGFCKLLLQILNEAERINERCLIHERSKIEFFHFSKANLELANGGKQSKKWVFKQLLATFSNATTKQYQMVF